MYIQKRMLRTFKDLKKFAVEMENGVQQLLRTEELLEKEHVGESGYTKRIKVIDLAEGRNCFLKTAFTTRNREKCNRKETGAYKNK